MALISRTFMVECGGLISGIYEELMSDGSIGYGVEVRGSAGEKIYLDAINFNHAHKIWESVESSISAI